MIKKGIVMEKGNNWIIVLDDQGTYHKIKYNGLLQVGEIWCGNNYFRGRYMTAAVIILLLIVTSLDFFSVKAYAQISPGVKMGLNRWDRIISVCPLNDSARQLLQESNLNLKGKNIEQGVQSIVESTAIKNVNYDQKIDVKVTSREKNDIKNRQRLINKINHQVTKALNKKGTDVKMIKTNNLEKKNYTEEQTIKFNQKNNRKKKLLPEKINTTNNQIPRDNNRPNQEIPASNNSGESKNKQNSGKNKDQSKLSNPTEKQDNSRWNSNISNKDQETTTNKSKAYNQKNKKDLIKE